jgi:hypothetical protein
LALLGKPRALLRENCPSFDVCRVEQVEIPVFKNPQFHAYGRRALAGNFVAPNFNNYPTL